MADRDPGGGRRRGAGDDHHHHPGGRAGTAWQHADAPPHDDQVMIHSTGNRLGRRPDPRAFRQARRDPHLWTNSLFSARDDVLSGGGRISARTVRWDCASAIQTPSRRPAAEDLLAWCARLSQPATAARYEAKRLRLCIPAVARPARPFCRRPRLAHRSRLTRGRHDHPRTRPPGRASGPLAMASVALRLEARSTGHVQGRGRPLPRVGDLPPRTGHRPA